MKPVMQMWLAAISSRYAESTAWMAWADDIISRSERPEMWVIEMSITPDAKKLADRLAQIWSEKGEPVNLFNHRKVYLGYRFALLRSGRITLADFCREVWTREEIDDAFEELFPDVAEKSYADAAAEQDEDDEGAGIDEGPYDVFLALGHRDEEFIRAAEARFSSWSREAEEQYRYLITGSAEDVLASV